MVHQVLETLFEFFAPIKLSFSALLDFSKNYTYNKSLSSLHHKLATLYQLTQYYHNLNLLSNTSMVELDHLSINTIVS